ncbi:MAG: molecular chaperone DnaJ [Chromatiales bacterium]|jgi:molecular chaperone DnaJ
MPTTNLDYYKILGVPRDAELKAIKQAFKHLAMKYHPDRNKAPDAEQRFKEIAEAYAVLSDPKKRAAYDARGHAGVAEFSTEDLYGGINFDEIFSDFGLTGFGLGGDLFSRLFGEGARREPRIMRGGNIQLRLEIPLEMVLQGGGEQIRFPRPKVCHICHGNGADPTTPPRTCSACGGSGQKVESSRQQGIFFQRATSCPVCQGRGQIIEKPCPGCGGSGELTEQEILELKIPVGVEEGMTLRIPGHGRPPPVAGGEAGDLYVILRTRPDERFERRGRDLWRSETISVTDAVLGCSREIPTLEGQVKVTIPAGTQSDEVLRLRGKGLPGFREPMRGDLLIRLRVEIPGELTAEERSLYEALRKVVEKGS